MSSRVVVTCEFALEFLQRKKKLVTCECAHVTREWSTLPRLLPFLDERAAGRDPAGPELVNSCRSSRKTAVAVGSGRVHGLRARAPGVANEGGWPTSGTTWRRVAAGRRWARTRASKHAPARPDPRATAPPCLVRVARLFAVTLQRLQGRSARIF